MAKIKVNVDTLRNNANQVHKQKTQAMVKVLETFRDYMQRAAARFEGVDHDGATRIRNS